MWRIVVWGLGLIVPKQEMMEDYPWVIVMGVERREGTRKYLGGKVGRTWSDWEGGGGGGAGKMTLRLLVWAAGGTLNQPGGEEGPEDFLEGLTHKWSFAESVRVN